MLGWSAARGSTPGALGTSPRQEEEQQGGTPPVLRRRWPPCRARRPLPCVAGDAGVGGSGRLARAVPPRGRRGGHPHRAKRGHRRRRAVLHRRGSVPRDAGRRRGAAAALAPRPASVRPGASALARGPGVPAVRRGPGVSARGPGERPFEERARPALVPQAAVRYRYLPLPAVTCRYLPLPTVTGAASPRARWCWSFERCCGRRTSQRPAAACAPSCCTRRYATTSGAGATTSASPPVTACNRLLSVTCCL